MLEGPRGKRWRGGLGIKRPPVEEKRETVVLGEKKIDVSPAVRENRGGGRRGRHVGFLKDGKNQSGWEAPLVSTKIIKLAQEKSSVGFFTININAKGGIRGGGRDCSTVNPLKQANPGGYQKED